MKVACTVAFLLFVSMAARAGPGLDLVVLLDRSTSMARDARLGTLLLEMSLDLIARNAGNHRLDHRLAVIGFGSSAAVEVPLTPVRPDDLTALRRLIASLPAQDRGDTNVITAFLAADELLRALPPDAERRRAIVLLTDGVPYVRGADMNAYRARLRRLVAERFADVSIDVLLAGEPRDRALWEGLARNVHAAPRSADAILAEAHGVIAQLAGTRTTESAPSKTRPAIDTLVVAPYLDIVVFDVFRAAPNADVAIYPPGSASPIRGGTNGVEMVGVGDVLTTLIVPRPPPGEWTIRKSRQDARVRILSQQFFPRGALVQPASSDDLRQHDRIPLAYRVLDAGNRPFHELRDYALAVEVSVMKPNGMSSLVPMDRDPALGPSIFRGMHEADCDLPGRYWTDVRITTTDAHGRRLEVFRDRWSGFSVAPAKRIDCRVSASAAAAWMPLTARLNCFSGQKPVDMNAIANGSPARLFRALLWREGHPADPALDLRYLGHGAFSGRLCTWSKGAYELGFTTDRSRLRAPYNVHVSPARLSFVRRTPIEWLAIPFALLGVALWAIRRRRKTRS